MEIDKNDAWEDLGSRTVPDSSRPTFDPGQFDYLKTHGERMAAHKAIAAARRTLQRQEHNARVISASQSDPASPEPEADQAGVRRRSA